jgi:hypothetical protein
MAYTRKATKQDIRTLHLAKPSNSSAPTEQASSTAQTPLPQTNPYREMIAIGIIAIPLMIALGIASYYDSTHHWVIPTAQRILTIGK